MDAEALIFDLDGTVTHTLPLCIRAFREAVEPLAGRAFSDAEIIATFGPSEEGTITALVPDRYDEGLAAYLAAYERLMEPRDGPFDGIRDWLAALRASGMKLALVTGKGAGSTELTLSRFGLGDLFEHVATGSPQGSVKARRIREIVELWGIAPERVVYLGDAPSNVTAAREAGVRIVSVTWSREADAAHLRSLNPDPVVASIAEARAWLQGQDDARIVRLAQQVQALAQTGLAFTKDRYDIERYEALREVAAELMSCRGVPRRKTLTAAFEDQIGYATPKIDTRAIVLRTGRVLLVREAEDSLWSLPGGWADVGDSPSEAVMREVREETGLQVSVDRLLGVWDRNLHGHPPYPFHAYKLFFLCKEQGGGLRLNRDTLEIDFFDPDQLPPLSLTRVVPVEIQTSVRIAITGAMREFG